MTKSSEILRRIERGEQFMKTFAAKDKRARRRFLDGAAMTLGTDHGSRAESDGGDIPLEQSLGNVNWLTVNTLIKLHSIAINEPDFYVEHDDPEQEESVRRLMRKLWVEKQWAQEARYVELCKDISGHGWLAYRWSDSSGVEFEPVESWDLIVDPTVKTTKWHRMAWAGRKIKLSAQEAKERYGSRILSKLEETGEGQPENPSDSVECRLYWDQGVEAHVIAGEVFPQENLYGRIPLLNLCGDENPRSPFHLGDFDLASSLQALQSLLQDAVVNTARHGGSLTLVNVDAVADEEQQERLINGDPQGILGLSGVGDLESVVKRFPADPVNPAVAYALELAMKGIDATTGVSDYQRGTLGANTPKTATEAVLLAEKSGSRAIASRLKFERFVNDMATVALDLIVRFSEVRSVEEYELWRGLKGTRRLTVVEASTMHRDPTVEQQASMQLAELTMQLFAGGLPVNPMAAYKKVLRAFNVRDVKEWILEQQQQVSGGMLTK